jgi:hypothetical protein
MLTEGRSLWASTTHWATTATSTRRARRRSTSSIPPRYAAREAHLDLSFLILTIIQTASNTQQHPLESTNADLIRSLQKSFSKTAAEHFPQSTIGIYPTASDSSVAILLVANKYSPNNFWNGRWRSTYTLNPSGGGLSGSIRVDVHYYEDGNVRMSTSKSVEVSSAGGADAVVREIAKAENKFQEELNRAFVQLAEGSFKGLRRQLPVTRQRVEWEKIGGYRVCFALLACVWGLFTDTDCSSARTLAVDARSRIWEDVSLVCLDGSQVFIDRPSLVQKCRMSPRTPFPL